MIKFVFYLYLQTQKRLELETVFIRVIMGGYKVTVSRTELKTRIVEKAVEQFTQNGIKSVTMDDIAAMLGISKRTLYEIFADKEALLEECIQREQAESEEFVKSVLGTSQNVLEVLLKCYQRSIEKFHATNKRFFEDLKKYPKAYAQMSRRQDKDVEKTVEFFREGVRQGIFRDDINFYIMNRLVREQLDVLMNTDICEEYSFIEVYESIMFTYLRGISTERGAKVLEEFVREYRKKR